jgi:hypothetical protein
MRDGIYAQNKYHRGGGGAGARESQRQKEKGLFQDSNPKRSPSDKRLLKEKN